MSLSTRPSQSTRPPVGQDDGGRPAPAADGGVLRRRSSSGVVHLASLAVGYVGLLALMRGTWFRGDDFEFLANRVGPAPKFGLWMPHNEHWSTGPILIWRVLYDQFGMTSVLPYLAASLAAHTLAAHGLWRLMRRAGVGDWTSTGLAAVFLLLGAGYENITWAFQLGFMGSLALGLLSLVLLSRGGVTSLVAAVLVSLVSLTFSGVSVVLVGMAVLYLAVVRRWREAAVLAVVCGGVYLAWYVRFGRFAVRPPHGRSFADRMADVPSWSWRAVTSALEALFSAPGAGWLLLIALAFGLHRHLTARFGAGGVPAPVAGIVAALLGGLVAEVGSLALNRGDISLPDTSRYMYVVIALLLPLIGLALTGAGTVIGRVAVGVLVGYLVATQAVVLVARERPLERPQLQSDVLGLAALTGAHQPVFPTQLAVDVNQKSVGSWAARGDLGNLGDVPADAVADARALAQVQVGTAEPAGATGGIMESGGGPVPSGSCVDTETTPGDRAATLRLAPATTVSVVAENGGELAYQVVEPGPASRLVTVPLEPHRRYWFGVSVPLSMDVVAKQGQVLHFCTP